MIRLYNEHEMLTDEGLAIDQAASKFARQLLHKCAARGYSLRDAELAIVNSVTGTAAEVLLIESLKRQKETSACPTTSAT